MNVRSRLRKIAKQIYGIEINKFKTVRAFYLPQAVNPKVMVIMQNPGKISKKDLPRFDDVHNLTVCLALYNTLLWEWVTGLNRFFPRFLKNVNSYFLNIKNPTDNMIFNNIYFSDIIKSTLSDKEIIDPEVSFKWVIEEIRIIKPIVIFCFGCAAWQIFLKQKMVEKIEYPIYKQISLVHGELFYLTIDEKKIPIIPLVHMSPRSFNPTIKDTYFCYLEEGLKNFSINRL